jgi:hypothetical protein
MLGSIEQITRRLEAVRGWAPARVAPLECPHLALRPRWDVEGYLCEECFYFFSTEEAEQLCSETLIRMPQTHP